MPIPKLHTLILTSVDFRFCTSMPEYYGEESTIDFLTRVRDMVKTRKERRGMLLRQLEIRDSWQFFENAKGLQKYVERVVWDGVYRI